MKRVKISKMPYRINTVNWSGSRHRWVCTVPDLADRSGLMAFPLASRGFQRLTRRTPGCRTPIAHEVDLTVISRTPPPLEEYSWWTTSQ